MRINFLFFICFFFLLFLGAGKILLPHSFRPLLHRNASLFSGRTFSSHTKWQINLMPIFTRRLLLSAWNTNAVRSVSRTVRHVRCKLMNLLRAIYSQSSAIIRCIALIFPATMTVNKSQNRVKKCNWISRNESAFVLIFFFFFVFALHSAMHTNCSIRVYAEASLGYVRARFYRSDRWGVGGKSRMKGKTICDPKLGSEENAIRLYAIQNNVRQRNKKKEKKKKNRRIERRSDRRKNSLSESFGLEENSKNAKLRLSFASPDPRHSLSFSQSLRIFVCCFSFSSMRRCRLRRRWAEPRLLSQSLRVYHARQTALFLHNELSRARSPSKWKMKRVY